METCKFCGQPVDPNKPRALINHQYAHIDCMYADWQPAARAHQELNKLESEREFMRRQRDLWR